jgi:hypothetical protein
MLSQLLYDILFFSDITHKLYTEVGTEDRAHLTRTLYRPVRSPCSNRLPRRVWSTTPLPSTATRRCVLIIRISATWWWLMLWGRLFISSRSRAVVLVTLLIRRRNCVARFCALSTRILAFAPTVASGGRCVTVLRRRLVSLSCVRGLVWLERAPLGRLRRGSRLVWCAR